MAAGHELRYEPPADDPGSTGHEYPHDPHLPAFGVALLKGGRDGVVGRDIGRRRRNLGGSGAEVVTGLEVFEEGRMRRLPTELLLRDRARRRAVEAEEAAEPVEVVHGIRGVDAR